MGRVAIVLAQALLIIPAVNAIGEYGLQSGQSHTDELRQLLSWDTNSQLDRVLQNKIQCPICRRLINLGPTFLSDTIPYTEQPNVTCEIANSKSFYDNADYSAAGAGIVPKCNTHQDRYEEKCCEFPKTLPVYKCRENIHRDLFEDYDTSVVPLTDREDNVYVTTLFNFWALKELDIMTSTLDIFVDIYLSWRDPRLAWNVTSESCVTSTFVRASNNAETTQIWVPELDLINKESGLRSMEDASAQVSSDGIVRWVRSGRIKALCNFKGLGKMPFDTLSCRVAFGDPITGDVKYILVNSGYGARGVSFPDFTQTYTEYTVVKEKTTSTADPFSIVLYFERASRQHIYLVIIPTIVFVCLSFGQFFFPSNSGERVTYCVTMLLIVVAQSIVTSEILPHCKENIWLNSFIISCQFFVIFGTCESLIFYCLMATKVFSFRGTRRGSTESSAESAALTQLNDSQILDMDRAYGDEKRSRIDKMLYFMSRVDYYTMFALPLSYVLYVIIMFVRVNTYND